LKTERIGRLETFVLKAPPLKSAYWGSASWGQDRPVAARRSLSAEYPPQARRRYIYSPTLDCVLVRLETESGCVGWGEAKAPVGAEATARIIDDLLAPMLIGANPLEVRLHWERMYSAMRVRGHSTGFWLEAIAGADIALWDLAGQLLDQPAYVLLGGKFRDRLRVYASGLPGLYDGSDPSALHRLADMARDYVSRGYTAIKMALGHGIENDVRAIETVRDAIGSEVDLFVDAAGVYEPQQAIRLGRHLERLGVGWFEMPIPTDNLPGYVQVAQALDVPVALDALVNRFQARDYISAGGLDIIQPDVCRAGGITESVKMAEVADLYGAACAPHVSIGSAIQFAATLHLALATPNLLIAEQNMVEGNPLGDPLVTTPVPRPRGGYLEPVDGPGLGVVMDEAAVRRMAAT
jgi:D-arabinonate dehydratase/D-galactarolactone cycloisomerase